MLIFWNQKLMIGSAVVKKALEKLDYSELRLNQRLVIENNIAGKDVLFCSPLGNGKSLTFRAAHFIFKEFIFKGLSSNNNPCVAIVVSPLTSLMKTQVKNLQAKGMKAVYLRDICQTLQPFQEMKLLAW